MHPPTQPLFTQRPGSCGFPLACPKATSAWLFLLIGGIAANQQVKTPQK
jgi:hypothetical protein